MPALLAACVPPLPDCPDGPLFSHSPVAAEDLLAVVPLGNLNPARGHVFPTRHIYFYLAKTDWKNAGPAPDPVNVYAPGDITITSVSAQEHLMDGFTDYQCHFACCEGVTGYLLHLDSLSAEIMAALGAFDESRCETYYTGGRGYRNCDKAVRIPVPAGALLGTAGGNPGQNALDFGLVDSRVPPHAYANPDRVAGWAESRSWLHAVCPLDYFADAVKWALESRLGSGDGLRARTAAPPCGETAQDVPGTAQGLWFMPGAPSPSPEDLHLALVYDNVDPSVPVFSVGTSIPGLDAGVYSFVPEDSGPVNRDFSEVVPGAVYRYCGLEQAEGVVILLQLPSPTTLKIEALSGNGCDGESWAFSLNAVLFER